MKFIAAVASIAVVFAICTAAIIVYVFYPKVLTDQIVTWVNENTGQSLQVSGPSHISLWPEPIVSLQNVSLVPSPDQLQTPMIAANEFQLKTTYSAIFNRQLEVMEISLIGPTIKLRIDPGGTSNWMFPRIGNMPVILLRNGSLDYSDERLGQKTNVTEIDAVVRSSTQDHTIDMEGSFIWNRQPARLSVYVRAPERFMTEGSPASIAFQAPQLMGNFDGRVSFVKGFGLAGQLRLSTSDFSSFAAWTGITPITSLGVKSLNISGSVDASHKQVAISRAEVNVNGADAIGDMMLLFGKSGPALRASLVTDDVDLNRYLTSGFRFEELNDIDANLRIAAKSWSGGPVKTGAADVYANIKNGVLEAHSTDVEIYGGSASITLRIDATQTNPSLKFSFSGADLNSGNLLVESLGHAAVSAKSDIGADLTAYGRNMPEVISTLSGKINFSARNGQVNGPDLPRLLADVSRSMVEGWRDGSTHFDNLKVSFDVKDGIAETTDLQLSSKEVSLTGKGEADLLRRALEFKIDPRLAIGNTSTTLPVPLVVRGSWYKPKFYPDIPGILEDPDAAYKALKQLGAPEVTESN